MPQQKSNPKPNFDIPPSIIKKINGEYVQITFSEKHNPIAAKQIRKALMDSYFARRKK